MPSSSHTRAPPYQKVAAYCSMRKATGGLAVLLLLLLWFGPCQSKRVKATCSLEIVGNSLDGGLKSVKLDCRGSELVEVGVHPMLVYEQHSRQFTGVNVSTSPECQQPVIQGISMKDGTEWGPDGGGKPRLYPLVYFCGDIDLTLQNVTVSDVWFPDASQEMLMNITMYPMPSPVMDYLMLLLDEMLDNASMLHSCRDVSKSFADYEQPTLADMYVFIRDLKLKATAAVAFGGRVKARLTGVLQGNFLSSVIVAAENSTVELMRVQMQKNVGLIGTGLVAVGAAQVKVALSNFLFNAAILKGGVLAAGSGTTIKVANSTFKRNIAASGGALCMSIWGMDEAVGEKEVTASIITSKPCFTVTGSSFVSNCAIGGIPLEMSEYPYTNMDGLYGSGGAVWVWRKSASRSQATPATSNTRVNITFDDNIFSNNYGQSGGAVDGTLISLQMRGCQLQGNLASVRGGALHLSYASAKVERSTFTTNVAEAMGGGFAVVSSGVALLNSSIIRNFGNNCGGGIYVDNLHGPSMINMSGSVLDNNTAEGGGAICVKRAVNMFNGVPTPQEVLALLNSSGDNCTSMLIYGAQCADHFLHNATIGINNSIFVNNNAKSGWGWDMYAEADTWVDFGCNVTIHKQNDSVLWMRNCTIGEVATGGGSCMPCPKNSYSLQPGGLQQTESCQTSLCGTIADCFGGALITPHAGFWHAVGSKELGQDGQLQWPSCSLSDVSRCPNQLACSHSPVDLVANNSFNPNITFVASWEAYQTLLCTKGSGYTGLLCASCKPGYGQTDAFTCETCLGVLSDKQGQVNRPLIWGLMFVYGAVFAVFIFLTIQSGVQESDEQEINSIHHDMQVTDVIKALTMYAQYFAGVIAKLPVAFPPSISNTLGTLGAAWSTAFGCHASLDCLLTPPSGERAASQAGKKGLITLLTPIVLLAVTVLLQILWWVVWPHYVRCVVQLVQCLTRQPWVDRAAIRRWFGSGAFLAQPRARQEMWFMRLKARQRRHLCLREYLTTRWTVTVLVVCFFFFPSIARVGVGMFACQPVCQASYWVLDMTRSCPRHDPFSEHGHWAFGVGVPAVLFIVVLPLLVVAVLWTAAHRQLLQKPWFIQKFGFMFSDYEVHVSQQVALPGEQKLGTLSAVATCCRRRIILVWDAVIHVQTVSLMFVSVYGMMIHEYYQVLILTIVFGFYLILVVWLRPFRVHANQQLQAASTAVLFGTSLCMLTFIKPEGLDKQQQNGYEKGKTVMGWFVLVANALFVAVGVVLLAVSAVQLVKRTLYSGDVEQRGSGVDGSDSDDLSGGDSH